MFTNQITCFCLGVGNFLIIYSVADPQQKNGVKVVSAKDPETWRRWLAHNFAREKSVWLVIYKKLCSTSSVYYDEAVDEALCFGWIDSKPNKRDETSYFQFFSQRNPKSNWSKVNKQKVARLLKEGRLAAPGLEMVRLAKETGTWTALDDVENLVVPNDLQQALNQNAAALRYFNAFPPSARRGILEWLFNAKRPTTRQQRIEEIVAKAAENVRANQDRR